MPTAGLTARTVLRNNAFFVNLLVWRPKDKRGVADRYAPVGAVELRVSGVERGNWTDSTSSTLTGSGRGGNSRPLLFWGYSQRGGCLVAADGVAMSTLFAEQFASASALRFALHSALVRLALDTTLTSGRRRLSEHLELCWQVAPIPTESASPPQAVIRAASRANAHLIASSQTKGLASAQLPICQFSLSSLRKVQSSVAVFRLPRPPKRT